MYPKFKVLLNTFRKLTVAREEIMILALNILGKVLEHKSLRWFVTCMQAFED